MASHIGRRKFLAALGGACVAARGARAAAGNGGGRIFLVRVVAFYKKCGTCEQWIKEGKGAISLAARPEKREYLRRFEVIRGIPAQC